MKKLRFALSERERVAVTREQMQRIRNIYRNEAERIRKKMKDQKTVMSSFEITYSNAMVRELDRAMENAGSDIENMIVMNLQKMSESVFRECKKMMQDHGLEIKCDIVRLAQDVVETIVSGQLYESSWSLSAAIWGAEKRNLDAINDIIAAGAAANKSAYDVAVDLEKYVNPDTRTDSRKIQYMDVNGKKKEFYFGQVDYNAQRLARTMLSHAYQESFVRSTLNNPFITKYQWVASNSRPCPICQERNGKLFNKNELPLDHPNGMCTFISVIQDDDVINKRIAEWARSPRGTFSDIDRYADGFGI